MREYNIARSHLKNAEVDAHNCILSALHFGQEKAHRKPFWLRESWKEYFCASQG